MSAPRLVLVYRTTELDELTARHASEGALEFFLASRGRNLASLKDADFLQKSALEEVSAFLPEHWRLALVERSHLPRFLFEPDDFIVIIGQDGLVANVAKYLDQQLVAGVDPKGAGQLCTTTVADVRHLLDGDSNTTVEARALVEAQVDDGQILTALNELYVGDQGHQSSRYVLSIDHNEETQSSSGVLVGTGTGSTGWLASLWKHTQPSFSLPQKDSTDLAYFVREAWPSATTQSDMTAGLISAETHLSLTAMGSLVVFGDGMEKDRLALDWGQKVDIHVSDRKLHLIRGSYSMT